MYIQYLSKETILFSTGTVLAIPQIRRTRNREGLGLTNWWKCQILSDNKVTFPFMKGDLVYAKGEAEWIMLFDGRREIKIDKMAGKNIRFLSRLAVMRPNMVRHNLVS